MNYFQIPPVICQIHPSFLRPVDVLRTVSVVHIHELSVAFQVWRTPGHFWPAMTPVTSVSGAEWHLPNPASYTQQLKR